MVELNKENKRIFGEQVNDHIEKLNDLMGLSIGEAFEDMIFRKACLATKLLEGSTSMLGLFDWSSALERFRKLIEACSVSGRCWDDNLSQIVSEILETEEQVVAEILTGEVDEMDLGETFEGLKKEIEALQVELIPGGECEAAPSLQFEPVPLEPAAESDDSRDGLSTLDMLLGSLNSLRERLNDYLEDENSGTDIVRDMEIVYGESEFFIGLVGDVMKRLGDGGGLFLSRVTSCTVRKGVQDFFHIMSRLRKWNAKLEIRSNDFTLDREAASALAVILENCLFDICRMYEGKKHDLDVKVDISNEGSYLFVNINDNGPDFLSDTMVDGCDAVAYYKGLLCVRNLLEYWGGLLRVEPDGGKTGRFHFTLPYTNSMKEYYVFCPSGKKVAVPCHCTDTIVELEGKEVIFHGNCRYFVVNHVKVPVYGLDELAVEEVLTAEDGDHLVVIGLAEKRIGILSNGPVHSVRGVPDQLVEGNWAELTRYYLHVGEEEYPVLDVGAVLAKSDYLQDLEDSFEESGSFAEEEEVTRIN